MESRTDNSEDPKKERNTKTPIAELIRRPYLGDAALTENQIHELKAKYNIRNMTSEEEETLLQDLKKMGVLTKEECGSFFRSAGNILETMSRQFSADINLLYKMAIAGRYSILHIEHLQHQQKILNVLEQLVE
jgi:hypothetical protein